MIILNIKIGRLRDIKELITRHISNACGIT